MTQRTVFSRPLAIAAIAVALTVGPAVAAPPSPSAIQPAARVNPVFGGYWSQFIEHWSGMLKKQNGVIAAALGVGAVSLFIITRGKWQK